MNEKVRSFIYVLALTVLLVLLWNTTPPEEISLVGFVERGVISVAMVYLCFFAKRPGEWLSERMKKVAIAVAGACVSVANLVLCALDGMVEKFLEWSAAVSLEDVEMVRDKIQDECRWKDGKEKKEANRPIRVLCRWTDLMYVCLFVALTCGAGMAVHYQRPWIAAMLNVLGFISILLANDILNYATISGSSSSDVVATEPTAGLICVLFQTIILALQLVCAIIDVLIKGEIQTSVLYEPYFTVRLEEFCFEISPLQMVILVSTMVMLLSFVKVCTSLHAMVELPTDEEMAEE